MRHSNWLLLLLLLLPLLLWLLLFILCVCACVCVCGFFLTVVVFVNKELLLASISKWANGKAFSYFTDSAHTEAFMKFLYHSLSVIYDVSADECVCVCVTYALHVCIQVDCLFGSQINLSGIVPKRLIESQQIRRNKNEKQHLIFWRVLSVNFHSIHLTFNKSQASAFVCVCKVRTLNGQKMRILCRENLKRQNSIQFIKCCCAVNILHTF